jgi:hypothetical protein
MTYCRTLLGLLIIGILPLSSAAATTVSVDIGWGNAFRVGRWTPLFITVSDPTPRNADLEVRAPHDPIHAMIINQRIAVGPAPATYVVYVPLVYPVDDLSIRVRDSKTHREIAHELPFDWSAGRTLPVMAQELIMVSGTTVNRGLETLLSDSNLTACRWVNPLRLPAAARGYDAVSVLVLSEPDLARMPAEQQTAIVDWVRAGGEVVCAFGPDALPGNSPLMDVMPVVVGENRSVQLSEAALKAADVPLRFRALKARQLTPQPGAEAIRLLDGELTAYRRRLGVGRLTVTPVDFSGFSFRDTGGAIRTWTPLLGERIRFRTPDTNAPGNTNQMSIDPAGEARTRGTAVVMEQIGDIPGAGTFDFTYVAITLIALMLVVGPVDWFVLKKLDRQPWTWITTSGWIILLTVGAIYLGNVVKSGKLHFRTIRLIDQAGGATIATLDAAGIYSPRTRYYSIATGDDQWWEPLSAGLGYSRQGMKVDLRFRQTHDGNLPDAMEINVWNLRMISGERFGAASPALDASLSVATVSGARRVQGTITNRTESPLHQIIVRVGADDIAIGKSISIAPGASATIDLPLAKNELEPTAEPLHQLYDTPMTAEKTYYKGKRYRWRDSVWDLPSDRTLAIERWLAADAGIAVVYAQATGTPPAAMLEQPAEQELHQQFIRAVVPLGGGAP